MNTVNVCSEYNWYTAKKCDKLTKKNKERRRLAAFMWTRKNDQKQNKNETTMTKNAANVYSEYSWYTAKTYKNDSLGKKLKEEK